MVGTNPLPLVSPSYKGREVGPKVVQGVADVLEHVAVAVS
jgi:hypothetical protein